MPNPSDIARSLTRSATLTLQHWGDGDTWVEAAKRIPRTADGSKRHWHHCVPPLIGAGLLRKTGTKQLEGRAILDDVFVVTELGKEVRELL